MLKTECNKKNVRIISCGNAIQTVNEDRKIMNKRDGETKTHLFNVFKHRSINSDKCGTSLKKNQETLNPSSQTQYFDSKTSLNYFV